jgi:hypothetical protein
MLLKGCAIMHKYVKMDVKVIDSFIQKFANRYLEQRSLTKSDYKDIGESASFRDIDFDTNKLRQIIMKNAIPIDKKREQGLKPAILNDIYRSDLGELLMTYYFEEKLPESERFVIPLKNITFRELAEQPGGGLDAIGYKYSDGVVEILLGEAKVSTDKKSPPAVVDSKSDSLYKTQLKHKNDIQTTIRRLTDYAKRLGAEEREILLGATYCIELQLTDLFSITYGCTLIRDHSCVNETTDFGKLKSNKADFEPGSVHFSILSFSNKSMDETVDLFYQKVQELATE